MPILKRLSSPKKKQQSTVSKPQTSNQLLEQEKDTEINGNINETVQFYHQLFKGSDDFNTRRLHVFNEVEAILLYMGEMVDKEIVNTNVLKPLMSRPAHMDQSELQPQQLKEILLNDSLYYCEMRLEKRVFVIAEAILAGDTVLLLKGMDEAFLIDTRSIDKRAIAQPATEQVIRGSREGFIEQLGTNIGLLRYRLQSVDFCVKMMRIGRVTKSKVAVCYLDGIVNPALVDEVQRRLSSIDIDGILDSGYLEQLIEDNHFSPFPQVQNTERPDKVAANLLEGRVAILMDGSPFALIVPTVFNQFYQVTEDYNERFMLVSFIRLARLVALIFSLITPSLYVAVISFNPELIPTKFAVAVAGGRAGVPFPSVVEVLIMEISMEVLREATVRLPQQVGGALSIVGVLVIGQAAVSAGFVSPITVVVIALTTIGSFATPAYNAALALRLLRFPLILFAGTFGLYGVMVGFILIANHLLSLKSFGVPYVTPLVPGSYEGMKDTVIRPPLWWMKKRPAFLHTPNRDRLGKDTTQEIKLPPVNTLDPLKVGNPKGVSPDGVSQTSDSNPSGSRTD